MKHHSGLAAVVISVFLIIPAHASLQAVDTVRLPGGPIHMTASPASVRNEADSLLVIRLSDTYENQRQILKHAGIILQMPIAPNTWWATTNFDGSLPASTSITAIYKPLPSDKIVPILQHKISAADPDKKMSVRVSFLPGVTVENANAMVAAVGGSTTSSLYLGGSIEALLPAAQIRTLAASNHIVAVEPAGRPRRPLNRRAARLSKADVARTEFSLSGAGIVAGIWDGGPVFAHKEFGNRLIVAQFGKSDDHATHVAGTIGAAGLKTKARGFAPGATIVSYDFFGDVAFEIGKALDRYGVALANNSWGLANGWEWEGEWVWYGDEYFGSYSSDARSFDEMVADTGIIVLFAAGNDRGDDGPGNGRYYDWTDSRYKKNAFHPPDGPYDTIGEIATAKNVIAVGAVKDNGPMTSFSAWGPTDDGRIKPEITANGQSLYSTLPRNRYGNSSGTSMSTPAVTGGLTLVSEMWQRIHGERLKADMARALLAATAIDAGRPGPDYSYGFGIMNVAAMVELIDAGTADYGTVSLKQRRLHYKLDVPAGTRDLRISIAWLDPAAAPFAQVTLVNDLDLRITAPDGTVYRPWKLNPAAPTANAAHGINSVDNIELVEVAAPAAGSWKITVEGRRLGSGTSQKFAIVAGGSTNLKLH